MQPPRNEVDATDTTDHAAKPPLGFAIVLIAGLHVLCCGVPLMLVSGVSLAAIFSYWPVMGAVLGLMTVGMFICGRCAGPPRQDKPEPPPKVRDIAERLS